MSLHQIYTKVADIEAGTRDLREFQAEINRAVESIPSEHLDDALIEFKVYEDYGNMYCEIEIGYTRDKTPEELEADRAAQARKLKLQEAREREELRKLLSKYGKQAPELTEPV